MNTATQTLHIELDRHRYPILIGERLLANPAVWSDWIKGRPFLVITNRVVGPLLESAIQSGLGVGLSDCLVLEDGESTKTLATLSLIYDALAKARVARDGVIIAIGGGVVGDMAGFAAATWQRGIDVIQVPTTLLAQVDSSVGGKTAVNHAAGKNLIGAFHQPQAVIADVTLLQSLPTRELSAGLAEIIKYGLIEPGDFWDWLDAHMEQLVAREPAILMQAIKRSCAIKARIVSEDEREQSVRATLNFGHTFGHAIETGTHYRQWLHGEAVALGMLMAVRFSEEVGLLRQSLTNPLERLLLKAQLPTEWPRLGGENMFRWMGMDKKVLQSKIRLVLLSDIGAPLVTAAYSDDRLLQFLKVHCDLSALK